MRSHAMEEKENATSQVSGSLCDIETHVIHACGEVEAERQHLPLMLMMVIQVWPAAPGR